MKIVVIGTSNSVKKNGWLKSFILSRSQDTVINLSIGANCSLLGITRMLQEEKVVASSDLILFDFAVNDSFLVSAKALTNEQVEEYLSAAIAHTAFLNKHALLVVFPSRWETEQQSITKNTQIYLDVSRRYGISIFNGNVIAKALYERGIPLDIIFEDGSHLSDPIAQIIGIQLSRCVDEAMCQPLLNSDPIPYRYLSVHQIPEMEVNRIENSLLSLDVAMLDARKKEICIQLGKNEKLHALVVNSGSMGGMLEITNGKRTVVKDLYDKFSYQRPIRIAIVTLLEPMEDPGYGICLRIQHDSVVSTEKTGHEGPKTNARKVEFAGFIISTGTFPLKDEQVGKVYEYPTVEMIEIVVSLVQSMLNATAVSAKTYQSIPIQNGAVIADVMRDIGLFFKKMGKFHISYYFLEQAYLKRPDGPWIQLYFADILRKTGHLQESKKVLATIESVEIKSTPLYEDLMADSEKQGNIL